MDNERQNVAVYGDLTALYDTRERHRKPINYATLDTVLKATVGLRPDESFDVTSFFTIFSSQNDKQVSFVKTLRELQWEVETTHPREIRKGMRPTDHRFTADIGYELGLGVDQFNKVLIVSDSFELARPILRFADEDKECEVHLAFFSESLDSRWWPLIRSADSCIKFTDLDTELYKAEEG